MTTPREIKKLVERFRENRDVYCSSAYNETQARHEFIDPFFIALGWDVNNESGHAEAYKDVIHEDAIKVGGATKAPDYAFRIGGVRKFFVEAKRPGVNIKQRCGVPTATLRVVGEAPALHPHRLRGVRGLRLPDQTGQDGQGVDGSCALPHR